MIRTLAFIGLAGIIAMVVWSAMAIVDATLGAATYQAMLRTTVVSLLVLVAWKAGTGKWFP